MDLKAIESLVEKLLANIEPGQFSRAGLIETPQRVARAFNEIFAGYHQDPKDLMTAFDESSENKSMILCRNIEFYSTCEHHMMPFAGHAHVAYLPRKGRIIGLSKLARLVDCFARRLQIQERIGEQVTSSLDNILGTEGSACILVAKHFCMCCRGANKQNSEMVTSSLTGEFMRDFSTREELYSLIKL